MNKGLANKFFVLSTVLLPTYEMWRGSNNIKSFFAKKAYNNIAEKINWGRDIRITGSKFTIGDFSSVGTRARIQTPTVIGKDVMMGANVKIFRENHCTERTDIPMHSQGMTKARELVIGDDVWICDSVIITPSCEKIGKGSILAAGAVCTKNIGEYEIWGGNPAKCLGVRK